MSKKMLIDARHPEETRVAVLSGGRVEDFDFESLARKPLRGNIYLARITRVEPSLQAAFVEYGGNRHGFLAFSEIHPDYYQVPVADREILREAEALEAELAAKLAEYDQSFGAVDDDDDDGVEARGRDTDSDDDTDDISDDAASSKASSDEDDSEESSGRRGRGRRRRRRRGKDAKPDASSSDAEADAEGAEQAEAASAEATDADAEASDDTDGAPVTAEDSTAEEQAEAPQEASTNASADGDEASPQEVPLAEETVEAAEDEGEGDAEPDDANGADGSDDPDSDGTPPRSMALEDAGEPKIEQELGDPDTDVDDTPLPEAFTDAPEQRAGEDEEEAVTANDEADEAPLEAAVADEEASTDTVAEEEDDADSAEAEAEADDRVASSEDASDTPVAREKTPEEIEAEEAAKAEAAEIADLRKRYEQARRERDKLLRNYRIQEVIKRRQILLVQVVKEERGNKGAALTTYMSLAGRYGVLMPNNARGGGVSRKITNASDRKRLRNAMAELNVPKGQGLIIRTAGAKRTKAEIKRDYDYLARLWDSIRELTLKSIAPCMIYEEASLIKRAIRDLYDKDTNEILVEGDDGYREAKDFMKMLMPSHAKHVQPYRESTPLFLKYDVERQLDEMYQPVVTLRSGGYLVIQQTEALISIDVNSGKSTKERNVEATALKTNSEAAVEVARQCRLRDLAGLLVIDFIDMDENRNNRTVEKKLKEALKQDRARIQIGSISGFGLLEMSRQRRRSGIVDGTTQTCPTCDGAGVIRSVEMAALRVLRAVEAACNKDRPGLVCATTSSDVALYVLNQKRNWLHRIEEGYSAQVEVLSDPDKTGDQFDITKKGKAPEAETLRQGDQTENAVTVDDLDENDDATAVAAADADAAADSRDDTTDDEGKTKKRRRRGGRGRKRRGDDAEESAAPSDDVTAESESASDEADSVSADAGDDAEQDEEGKPKRRRRGRRGGRRNRKSEAAEAEETSTDAGDASDGTDSTESTGTTETGDVTAANVDAADESAVESADASDAAAPEAAETETAYEQASVDPAPQPETSAAEESASQPVPDTTVDAPAQPKRGGWWQRALGRK